MAGRTCLAFGTFDDIPLINRLIKEHEGRVVEVIGLKQLGLIGPERPARIDGVQVLHMCRSRRLRNEVLAFNRQCRIFVRKRRGCRQHAYSS